MLACLDVVFIANRLDIDIHFTFDSPVFDLRLDFLTSRPLNGFPTHQNSISCNNFKQRFPPPEK